MKEAGDSILDVSDASSVADYSAVFDNVRETRVAPINLRSFLAITAVLLLPFAPLVLLKVPMKVLLDELLKMIA